MIRGTLSTTLKQRRKTQSGESGVFRHRFELALVDPKCNEAIVNANTFQTLPTGNANSQSPNMVVSSSSRDNLFPNESGSSGDQSSEIVQQVRDDLAMLHAGMRSVVDRIESTIQVEMIEARSQTSNHIPGDNKNENLEQRFIPHRSAQNESSQKLGPQKSEQEVDKNVWEQIERAKRAPAAQLMLRRQISDWERHHENLESDILLIHHRALEHCRNEGHRLKRHTNIEASSSSKLLSCEEQKKISGITQKAVRLEQVEDEVRFGLLNYSGWMQSLRQKIDGIDHMILEEMRMHGGFQKFAAEQAVARRSISQLEDRVDYARKKCNVTRYRIQKMQTLLTSLQQEIKLMHHQFDRLHKDQLQVQAASVGVIYSMHRVLNEKEMGRKYLLHLNDQANEIQRILKNEWDVCYRLAVEKQRIHDNFRLQRRNRFDTKQLLITGESEGTEVLKNDSLTNGIEIEYLTEDFVKQIWATAMWTTTQDMLQVGLEEKRLKKYRDGWRILSEKVGCNVKEVDKEYVDEGDEFVDSVVQCLVEAEQSQTRLFAESHIYRNRAQELLRQEENRKSNESLKAQTPPNVQEKIRLERTRLAFSISKAQLQIEAYDSFLIFQQNESLEFKARLKELIDMMKKSFPDDESIQNMTKVGVPGERVNPLKRASLKEEWRKLGRERHFDLKTWSEADSYRVLMQLDARIRCLLLDSTRMDYLSSNVDAESYQLDATHSKMSDLKSSNFIEDLKPPILPSAEESDEEGELSNTFLTTASARYSQ